MQPVREREHTWLWLSLLIVAILCVVFAFVAFGGFWLFIPAGLCLLGILLLGIDAIPRDDAASDTTDSTVAGLLFLIAVVLLSIAVLFLVATLITVAVTRSSSPSAGPRVTTTVRPGSTSVGGGVSTQAVTVGTGVHLRAAATTDSAVIATMPAFATPVTLWCYSPGEQIYTVAYWYRATYDGQNGYVSAFWVDTGSDPRRTGLPRC